MNNILSFIGRENLLRKFVGLGAGALLAVLAAAPPSALAANRALILLQENSGRSFLDDYLDGPAEAAARAIIDAAAEGSESTKFQLQALGHYQHFINLSDTACTRARLLAHLISESVAGYTVDLAVIGHGNTNLLALHGDEVLTGGPSWDTNSVRHLLTQAQQARGSSFRFKLRLVFMCNCVGSTMNDDWLAIGAQVSVGTLNNDYMPEPMTTLFFDGFLNQDKRVAEAASDAYASTVPIWQVVPGYTTVEAAIGMTHIQASRPIVGGNGNLIFKDECQLALNESRHFNVPASSAYNFPGIYLVAGQTYSFTASGTWKNGVVFSTTSSANGYTPGFTDGARREPFNMMCLVGERFRHNNSVFDFIGQSGFRIGAGSSVTPTGFGFLNLFANDALAFYGDNSGGVSVTVTRVH